MRPVSNPPSPLRRAPSPVCHSAALRQKYGSVLFSASAESARIRLHSSQHPSLERWHTASGFSHPDEGRKRKRKFDPKELKVLVDGVNAHYHELKAQNGTINRRNAIWQEITNRVNAVGHKNRAPCEIKRRWQDVRRRTKEKVIINDEPGGVPSDPAPLDNIEEQVLLTFCEDEANGIHEIDTFISDQDLCVTPPYSSTLPSASSSYPPPAAPSPSPSWQDTLNSDSRPAPLGDLDHALLSEMKSQNNSVQDSLDVLTGDIRSMSRVMRVLRGDTRSISKNTLELVSAVTGLTAAVKELTRAVSERRGPQSELENGESTVHPKTAHTLRQGNQS